jgi:hypothetical protein
MRRIVSLSMVIGLVFFFATGCTDDNDVQPEIKSVESTASADDFDAADLKGMGRGQWKGEKVLEVEGVTGTIQRKNRGPAVDFTADLLIREFVHHDDMIYAVATLSNISGEGLPNNVVSLVGKTFHLPVTDLYLTEPEFMLKQDLDDPTCPILNLVLGPLNLDLLGLTVFLDTVTLVIGADPGEGQLLGNLLCGLVGILDPWDFGAITGILNDIIDAIGNIIGILN